VTRPYTDLSVDLETLGTDPGAVVFQVGLCAFDARGPRDEVATALVRVHPQSLLDAGMTVSWDTIAWWLRQSDEARLAAADVAEAVPLRLATHRATGFLREHFDFDFNGDPESEARVECDVWGFGPTLDVALLEELYRRARAPVPWDFRRVRCLRTLAAYAPEVPRPRPAIAHRADCDAEAQARWIRACVSAIERRTP